MDEQTSGYLTYAELNAKVIYEKITKNRALFLCIDTLDFKKNNNEPNPKVKIRSCIYDDTKPAGERILSEIDTFIPIGRFLLLAHNILSGVYAKEQRSDKKPKEYFTQYGGSYGPPVISTKFSIVDGNKNNAHFSLLSQSCSGVKTAKGAILPSHEGASGAEQKTVIISMTDDELKEFCLIGKAYIEQYISLDIRARLATIHEQKKNLHIKE